MYATAEVLCRIFTEGMDSLYLLALLLTGNHEQAERCFIAGFEECIQGKPIFTDSAHSWCRRAIIKNAIEMMSPEITAADRNEANNWMPGLLPVLSAVARLTLFERFVFVMSVLERYSNQECSLLLNNTRAEIVRARVQALAQMCFPSNAVAG